MSENVSILWVDDYDRKDDIKNLRSKRLNIEWVHPEDFSSKLQQYKSVKTAPDLFLIDFYLDLKPNDKGEKYRYHGLAVNALIRDKYPEHPIYLVTEEETGNGDARLSVWAQAAECAFDNILTLKEILRKGKETLYYDALDYREIRDRTSRNKINTLLELLKAPASIKEKITLVLPDQLKSGLMPKSSDNPEGNTISFTRWVRELLFPHPGLLYNKLYTATLLGVNSDGFNRISRKFEKALYRGIFSITTEPKWWPSEINDILFSFKKAQQGRSSDTWSVSTTIFSIPETEISKCVVCNESFPETVGTNIDNPQEIDPVHFKCSTPDKNRQGQLYFEGHRVFNKD